MGRLEDLLNKRQNTYYNNFNADIDKITAGIIFMYATWGLTHIQLISLITSLEEFPDINLFVFDIDSLGFVDYRTRNNLHSDGWGETVWVKQGKIVASEKKYDINTSSSISEKLKANNKSIVDG
jgi:hypothetical protein